MLKTEICFQGIVEQTCAKRVTKPECVSSLLLGIVMETPLKRGEKKVPGSAYAEGP